MKPNDASSQRLLKTEVGRIEARHQLRAGRVGRQLALGEQRGDLGAARVVPPLRGLRVLRVQLDRFAENGKGILALYSL